MSGCMPNAKVRLRSDAAREFAAAIEWYEADNAETAVSFLRAFDRSIERIADFPASGTMTGEPGVRQVLVPGFPYHIVYREQGSGDIVVVAVAHTARERGYWRARL
ncbi:MAG: hypothetical protein C0506_08870 [Anaerolinea sp.]|nr:hypothetical protein [Anaerolinea sp.]